MTTYIIIYTAVWLLLALMLGIDMFKTEKCIAPIDYLLPIAIGAVWPIAVLLAFGYILLSWFAIACIWIGRKIEKAGIASISKND